MGQKLENLFSWSKSRHEKFVSCERAYFFHYYLSWGGWEREAPERVRQIYALKKRTNRYAWAGNAVHEAIRESLLAWLSGRPVEAEALIERTRNRMRQEFAASLRKAPSSKSFWGLVEHENALEVSAEAWQSNWRTVETALRHFMASAWPRRFQALEAGRILEADSKDFESSFFMLEGIRLFAMPDVAFVGEEGEVHIVDWKTGKPNEENVEQVVGYALFVEARHGFPALGARVHLVYLNEGVEEAWVIDEGAVEKFRAFFEASVAAMQAKLLEATSNTAKEEACFLKTEEAGRCPLCPFLKACKSL